ncbi:MAG: response regulator, partial [Cyanobacteria bacterium J06598_3]
MRILLVDDDESLMESLATRLIHQRYAVDIAVNGGSAESFMDLFHYDLVVLDLMLPDGDGIEFCRQFRAGGYANPLMILTAKESTEQKVSALDAGADDYVVKPFDFDELCARIRALLRRDGQGLPAVLQWGPLALDPSTYETTFSEQLVRLTPKEFSMMELFLRHPHRVYSLSSIIEDLWSFEDPPGEDAIRTHIKGLRRKLQAAGAPKDLIKTVYGLGYRLNEEIVWDEPGEIDEQAGPMAVAVSEPGLDPASAPRNAEALSAKLAQACDRYLQSASQQIDSLEVTVEALMRGTLTPEIQSLGQLNAHKLTGSLGSFGMPEGSRIARQIEAHLQAITLSGSGPVCSLISPAAIAQLVEQLRLQLATVGHTVTVSVPAAEVTVPATPPATVDVPPVPSELPLLLLVSEDQALCQRLMVRGQLLRTVQLRVAHGPQAAAQCFGFGPDPQSLTGRVPDVLMIDLASGEADYTALLETVQQLDIPVVALADGAGLTLLARLALVEQGVTLVSDRTASPFTLIQTSLALLPFRARCVQVAIVDDDLEMLTLLKSSLAPWGFHVRPFESALACWQWLSRGSADGSGGKDLEPVREGARESNSVESNSVESNSVESNSVESNSVESNSLASNSGESN